MPKWSISDIKVKIHKYGYNKQIPGPIFKVKQGSSVTINFENNIDMPTTVHWHGLRHDIRFDGVPDISQEPVQPGESFEYKLSFPDPGMFWYHPHVREDVQQDLGLYGMILVEPTDPNYWNKVNNKEILVLDDLLLQNKQIVPYGKENANFALMGRFGNTILINGHTRYNLQVKKGEVIRFYIANVANVRPFNLTISNAKIKLVASDIGKYETEAYVDHVLISPGERYVIEVLFENTGEYAFQHITPKKTYQLGIIQVNKESATPDYASAFNQLKENQEIKTDIDNYRQYFDKPIDYSINLTLKLSPKMQEMMKKNMMDMPEHKQAIEWEDPMPMMNAKSTTENVKWILRDEVTGKENMDIKYKVKVGDVKKIRLINDPNSAHPMQHPIHLHGQRFLVLSIDGIPNENLAWKETVLVPAGSIVDVLVDFTNPGEWVMHCHISEHMEAGMITSFVVETELIASSKIVTSIDEDRGPPGSIHNLPRGCYIMKKRTSDEYGCFGCANEICKDEDLNIWDYTGQDIAKRKGFSCEATQQGCK